MRHTRLLTAGLLPLILVLGACSAAGPGSSVPATTPTDAPVVTPTAAPTTAAASQAPSAASGSTVQAASVGTIGTVLVAANGMTVYTFTHDVKDSGTSACTGGCLTKWPAVTVSAGAKPSAGAGVTGTLATITRADDGALQVTYNGLPLYFFSGDAAPGDAHGVYTNWQAVTP